MTGVEHEQLTLSRNDEPINNKTANIIFAKNFYRVSVAGLWLRSIYSLSFVLALFAFLYPRSEEI